MFRLIKRRLAIRSYVWNLSQELARRFGPKKFYTLEQVTRVAESVNLRTAYIAYAHAIYCTRGDFDAHYKPLAVACTYDGLRSIVSRRYFGGVLDFNAKRIIAMTRREDVIGGFSENAHAEDLTSGH